MGSSCPSSGAGRFTVAGAAGSGMCVASPWGSGCSGMVARHPRAGQLQSFSQCGRDRTECQGAQYYPRGSSRGRTPFIDKAAHFVHKRQRMGCPRAEMRGSTDARRVVRPRTCLAETSLFASHQRITGVLTPVRRQPASPGVPALPAPLAAATGPARLQPGSRATAWQQACRCAPGFPASAGRGLAPPTGSIGPRAAAP